MQGGGRGSSETGLTTEVEAEFNNLIVVLTGPDIMLQNPDCSKPFHVNTVANKPGIGAVVMQEADQHHHPRSIQYASHTREQELNPVR